MIQEKERDEGGWEGYSGWKRGERLDRPHRDRKRRFRELTWGGKGKKRESVGQRTEDGSRGELGEVTKGGKGE